MSSSHTSEVAQVSACVYCVENTLKIEKERHAQLQMSVTREQLILHKTKINLVTNCARIIYERKWVS